MASKPLDDKTLALSKQLLVAAGHKDVETVIILVGQGADPNYRNVHGETPLFAACEGGSMKIVHFLLDKGAKIDPNLNKTHSDQHLIHNACASGSEELVQFLAQKGQSLSVQAYDGSTPLHIAVRMGQVKIVEWLLQQKSVSVNKSDYGGFTALHVASMMVRLRRPCLELLVEAGAKMNSTTFRGDTPLHLAAHKPDVDLLTYLIERGAKIECIACERLKPCDGVDEKTQVFIKHETERAKSRKKEIKQKIEDERKRKKEEEKKRRTEEEAKQKEDRKRLEQDRKRAGASPVPGSSPPIGSSAPSASSGSLLNRNPVPAINVAAPAAAATSNPPSGSSSSAASSSGGDQPRGTSLDLGSRSPARGSAAGGEKTPTSTRSKISSFFSHKRSASASGTLSDA